MQVFSATVCGREPVEPGAGGAWPDAWDGSRTARIDTCRTFLGYAAESTSGLPSAELHAASVLKVRRVRLAWRHRGVAWLQHTVAFATS